LSFSSVEKFLTFKIALQRYIPLRLKKSEGGVHSDHRAETEGYAETKSCVETEGHPESKGYPETEVSGKIKNCIQAKKYAQIQTREQETEGAG